MPRQQSDAGEQLRARDSADASKTGTRTDSLVAPGSSGIAGTSVRRSGLGASEHAPALRQGLLLLSCHRMAQLLDSPRSTPQQPLDTDPNPDPDSQPVPHGETALDPLAVLCDQVLRSARAGLLRGSGYGELAGVMWGRLRCSDPWFWSQLLAAAQEDLAALRPGEVGLGGGGGGGPRRRGGRCEMPVVVWLWNDRPWTEP